MTVGSGMALILLVLLHVVSTTAAWHGYDTDCNATLPWNVAQGDYKDIEAGSFEALLRCPKELNGCSPNITACSKDRYVVTCSCEPNCETYGDCCWEAGPSLARPSSASCVRLNVEGKYEKDLYMVNGCNPSWPYDEARDGCEQANLYNETFYVLPVTSLRNVTYRNAFCALCNYDLDNTTVFWNVTLRILRYFKVVIPPEVSEQKELLLRPCVFDTKINESCAEGTDDEVVRKCQTYFAPVKPKGNETELVYKNVYCGLCNGLDLSDMECAPLDVVPEHWFLPQLRSGFRSPNLVALLRPVVSLNSCFSWHVNKCYIKVPQFRFDNMSMTDVNGTVTNSTNSTMDGSGSYDVRNYLTIICLSLSLICLFLKGLVFVLYKSSRTFSSRCTLCLAGTLFWSQLTFLLVNSFQVSKLVCTAAAMVLHYGFLSTFFWTTVLSFDIWKNVAGVRLTSSRTGGFFVYCLVAWGGPLIVIGLCAALNWAAPTFVLSPKYGHYSCWIGSLWGQVTFFLFPMVLLLLVDMGLYAHIVNHIRQTAKQAATFDFKGGGHRSHMALYIKLAFIMGSTWLLGFISVFVHTVAMDIIVIVLVGLQGVYLFFGFKDYTYFLPKRLLKKGMERTTSASSANTDVPAIERDPSGSVSDARRGPTMNAFEKME